MNVLKLKIMFCFMVFFSIVLTGAHYAESQMLTLKEAVKAFDEKTIQRPTPQSNITQRKGMHRLKAC